MLAGATYLLYRGLVAVVALLPLRVLDRLGQCLGFLAWLLLPQYRRLAFRNLQIAFGSEKPPAELRRIARRHFQRLGANLLATIKFPSMPVQQVANCVTVEHPEILDDALRAGTPGVVLISHLGCWELFAQISPQLFDRPVCTVFQSLRNRRINEHVRKFRARTGTVLFDRQEGFGPVVELLRQVAGLGILGDQHAGDHGLWTPLFGRLASTTPLPALLAKRTRAAFIPAAVYSDGPGRWRMVFHPRIDRPDDSIESLTARANAVLEEQIRAQPEDWFWVHNRWKTPRPNFLLPRYKRGIFLPRDSAPNELQPFRILIRSTNWLGDSVISAAAVRAIKRGRPDAHITIATPEKLTALWKLVPEVDEVLAISGGSLGKSVKLLRRQQPFDVAVLFPNSLRTALEVRLAGIPRRVGFAGHRRKWLLNQIVPEPDNRGPIRHQVNRYLHLAESLGADISQTAPQPGAERQLHNGRVKLGLCPGAEYGPAKRWLPERFAETAAAVAQQRDVQWVLFGTAADAQIGDTIAQQLGDKCVNRIGQTTLDQLITELRECQLLLTNDTGTMHLATFLGVPVVAVFGSTEHRLTGPLGDGHTVLRHHVECSPCFLRECPIDFRCMHAVTAEEATAAVLARLS
jgi:heptosyltransferase II